MKKISKFNSLNIKLVLIVLLLQIPAIIFSVTIVSYITKISNNKLLDTVRSSLTSQIRLAEASQLNAKSLVQTFYSDISLATMSNSVDKNYFIYQELQKTLTMLETGMYGNHVQVYFAYDKANDYFLTGTRTSLDHYERGDLLQAMKSKEDITLNEWQIRKLSQQTYLIYTIETPNFYMGACMSLDNLADSFYVSLPEGSSLILCEQDGSPVNGRGPTASAILSRAGQTPLLFSDRSRYKSDNRSYTVADISSPMYIVYTFLPSYSLFDNQINSNMVWFLFPIYILLSIPALLLFLKHQLIAPLNYIQFGYARVENNDLTYRMRENLFSTEFQKINRSFNSMVRQIRELKLEYYEQKIQYHKAENRYLRSIIYPHFLLNNLNMINNFAYQGNEEGIHNAILNLSQYLRYSISPSYSDHCVGNDIESMKSYLNLSQLAYPDRITYCLDYDKDVLPLKIPPLILCTLIENCIKHALTPNGPLSIDVSCKIGLWDDDPALICIISNNGPDFPEQILADINRNDNFSKWDTQHIGLKSIKNALYYTYGSDAEFLLSSRQEGGGATAMVRIRYAAIQENMQKGENHGHYFS